MSDTNLVEPQNGTSPDFPGDLLNWAGHRDGGVKKPFRKGTGRPAGARIMTPLLVRLNNWAQKLSQGEEVPTAILLVGGPGNGKTDAVDGLVEDLDHLLGLDGKLYEALAAKFTGDNADKPPRRIDIDLDDLVSGSAEHLKRTLSIVQDATEADPKSGKSAQAILLDELESLAEASGPDVYICCVNRGKLAEAYSEAQGRAPRGKTLKLLREITTAVTNSPEAKPCWPLDGFPSIVAWPMDIDTLVEANHPDTDRPVLQQVLQRALDQSLWPEACPAGEWCPFCTNRELLSSDGALDNLSELLRAFELGTGKRWTFRDLYSLVPYMIVGDEEDFVIEGVQLDPCVWAARQVQLLDSTRKVDEARRARALHDLVSHLYWHRLFPLWPPLRGEDYRNARKQIIKPLHKELDYVNDLFRFLAWPGRQNTSESISRLVCETFCPLLDPANASPNEIISTATTRDYTVREIDEYFSLSVKQGLKKVEKRLSLLERKLLQRLAAADEALGTDSISNKDRAFAENLQGTLRLFSSRLTKRSLGTQAGVYCHQKTLAEYKEAISDPGTLREVQRELKKLVNDQSRNLFIAPLMTTFAQPAPPRKRGVNLETAAVKVLPWTMKEVERPAQQLAYISVNGEPIPLTFELFHALRRLDRGLHPGSLNDEVFAMVDRLRARVAGGVVRDQERLLDDAVIVLEPTQEKVRFEGEGFIVDQWESTS